MIFKQRAFVYTVASFSNIAFLIPVLAQKTEIPIKCIQAKSDTGVLAESFKENRTWCLLSHEDEKFVTYFSLSAPPGSSQSVIILHAIYKEPLLSELKRRFEADGKLNFPPSGVQKWHLIYRNVDCSSKKVTAIDGVDRNEIFEAIIENDHPKHNNRVFNVICSYS
jgi:hypothetical protein